MIIMKDKKKLCKLIKKNVCSFFADDVQLYRHIQFHLNVYSYSDHGSIVNTNIGLDDFILNLWMIQQNNSNDFEKL